MARIPYEMEDLLESISVMFPGEWENELSQDSIIKDWYAVTTDDGIIAYFADESQAFNFRLSYINGLLNPFRASIVDEEDEEGEDATM